MGDAMTLDEKTRAPRGYRARCRRCDWTIDSPSEQWAWKAGADHHRKAHQPSPVERHVARYAYKGRLNPSQLDLMRSAEARTLSCHRTTIHPWDGPSYEEWYADYLPRGKHHWVHGLMKAGLLRVRPTWGRHGLYEPTREGLELIRPVDQKTTALPPESAAGARNEES